MGSDNIDIKSRCFRLSVRVIRFVDTLPRKQSAWIITDQLVRAVTSVGANLTEAKGSSSRLEFKRFNEIAFKSSNESLYWFDLLQESGMGDSQVIKELRQEMSELNRMLAAGLLKLKASLSLSSS